MSTSLLTFLATHSVLLKSRTQQKQQNKSKMKLNTKALKEIELGVPVITDGVYYATVTKAEIIQNKSNTGNNLYLLFKIADPVVTKHDGTEVANRGQVVVSRYISLVPTNNYDPNVSLKELAVAIGVPEGEDLNLEDLQGKKVKLKVAYREAKGGYNESNDIKRFLPLKPEDNFPEGTC